MTITKTPQKTLNSTATLRFGTQELLIDVSDIRKQVKVIGRLTFDSRMTDAQVHALEGVWNFLHAILDAVDTESTRHTRSPLA